MPIRLETEQQNPAMSFTAKAIVAVLLVVVTDAP